MRKKRGIRNIIGSLGSYFITMIFTFVTQAFLVKIMGIEYSGVNGLFTNIITMLSVAELGLGTTIIYKLYQPIAKKDNQKIKSWLNFYKSCYRIIAFIILIVGISIIPLVPIIVGKTSIHENISFLYIIALLDTVMSYLMTYKRSLLYADQKNYIINAIHIGYVIVMNITQILFIYLTKNFTIYLVIKVIYRILENLIINLYVNKNYPYILENAEVISKEEKSDIFKRIRAIFIQKISFVVNKGIDNILISVLLGITTVGYYTNYNLIATTLCGIIFQTLSGLTASVGDLLTENNKTKNYSIYKKINYINTYLTGLFMIGFANCIQPFISMWVGNEYKLDFYVILSFVIYIYSDSIRRSITIYKDAAGLCKEDKHIYIIMACINLVLSIILCKIINISGIILGTSISYLFLYYYSYPKYIFKKVFDNDVKEYYKNNLFNILLIILSLIISVITTKHININSSLLSFIINGILSLLIFSIIFITFSYKKEEFKYFSKTIIKKLKKEKNK